MTYTQFVEKEAARIGLDSIAERIEKNKGRSALLYCHDDPDGIASGIILKRLLKKKKVGVILMIPTNMELPKKRLVDDLRKNPVDMVFVLDKATMGYYDDYADIHNGIIVIDHHPLLGEPLKRITVSNPVLDEYRRCSASFVLHILASKCGEAHEAEDIASLVGLMGDWAIEPATDDISDYVEPFYESVKGRYGWLLEKIKSRPTMFDVKQRKKTTLLSQMTEIIFALGGGGFQYFYNDRDETLREITDGSFALRNLEAYLEKPSKFESENDFLEHLPEKERAKKMFAYYKEDWECTASKMRDAKLVKTSDNTDIFVFAGENVKLMPMVGSVELYTLPAKSEDSLFIMISDKGTKGFHFSFRSKKGLIHCGNFAHNLAVSFQERYGLDNAAGGGHPCAAECRLIKNFPADEIMNEFEKKLAEI
ncbi:MAG: hypothetical protein COT16_03235 [Elusimicrobia bacterium CG08_land_8_20_14_0_20_44_26]|nr:MAG: hypothetical protein COT16_03235 [Elusimicrobia bacterium CG08_land_8_20_14_0_20_44_26]